MASVMLSLSLPVSPINAASGDFDLGYEISSDLANLINVGRAVIVAAINIVVIGAPIALLGGLFGSLIGRAFSALASRAKRTLGGAPKSARRAARRRRLNRLCVCRPSAASRVYGRLSFANRHPNGGGIV